MGTVAAVALIVPLLAWAAWPGSATSAFAVNRIGGSDRYFTSGMVAEAAFPTGSANAILASGLNYPDALAGAYLAGQQNEPILLTDPNTLSVGAADALQTLKVKNVTVLGGSLAVSDAVLTALNSTASTASGGGDVVATRLFGPTRYDTAAAVAESGGTIGKINGQPAALVASGANFPDALSAGPAAFAAHIPILLTDPSTESSQTEAALSKLGVTQVILLGGTNAVSDAVASALAGNGTRTVTRIGGVDRTDTAAQFYEQIGIKDLNFSTASVFLANGTTTPAPDALAGSPLAGKAPTAILLSEDADNLGQYTTAEIQSHASTLTSGTILGGTVAISSNGQDAFASAAGGQGSSNTSGPITLNNLSAAPGGTITGTIADPSTVSTLLANGCGLNNQAVTFGSSSGAFTVTIPSTEPIGTCALTFTVTYNNGTPTANPSFTISVTSTTEASLFQAPSLVSVTVTRGVPPVANDTAAFTFNEPLATVLPNPAKFYLFRASKAYVVGVGAPAESGDTWTITFPPGAADNVTMAAVAPGAVTNTSGQPNFPASVPVAGVSTVPITTVEPDLTTVGSPVQGTGTAANSYTQLFTFDKAFSTIAFPSDATTPSTIGSVTMNIPANASPGSTITGTSTDTTTTAVSANGTCFDNVSTAGSVSPTTGGVTLSVTLPTTLSSGRCTFTLTTTSTANGQRQATFTIGNITTLYCTPEINGTFSTGARFESVEADGAVLVDPAVNGSSTVPNEVTATNILAGNACASATSVTVTFDSATPAASLNIVAGAVGFDAVENTANDTVGNPLGSAFISSGIEGNYPVLQEAAESAVPVSGEAGTTTVDYFFTAQIAPPTAGAKLAAADFVLVGGDGRGAQSSANVAVDAVIDPNNPAEVDASFKSTTANTNPVATAVAATIAGNPVIPKSKSTTDEAVPDQAVPLTASGTPNTGQINGAQLTGVAITTNALTGPTVVFSFDETISSVPSSSLFFLYDTTGSQTAAASGAGTLANPPNNTVSFSCLFGTSCSSGWDSTVTAAAVVGGVYDGGAADPATFPPAGVEVTINGQPAVTTTSTSTTSTTAP